jgi:hypothetical protein
MASPTLDVAPLIPAALVLALVAALQTRMTGAR